MNEVLAIFIKPSFTEEGFFLAFFFITFIPAMYMQTQGNLGAIWHNHCQPDCFMAAFCPLGVIVQFQAD